MKVYIDLLPDQRKNEIKRQKRLKRIIREEILFLFPFFILIVILLNVYYILIVHRNSAIQMHSIENNQQQFKELGIYEKEFLDTNGKVGNLLKIQTAHLKWTNLFSSLEKAAGDGVTLNGLATKDYQVSISGKANTRENLLSFKDNLSNSDCFKDINVPLSNLVVKENVDFQIDFNVKQECIKK